MNRVQIAVLGVTVLAFGGAYVLFNSGQAPPPQIIQVAPKDDTDEVLVAARDLPMGTQLAETDFTWQKWPMQALSELMIKKSEGPQAIENAKGEDRDPQNRNLNSVHDARPSSRRFAQRKLDMNSQSSN